LLGQCLQLGDVSVVCRRGWVQGRPWYTIGWPNAAHRGLDEGRRGHAIARYSSGGGVPLPGPESSGGACPADSGHITAYHGIPWPGLDARPRQATSRHTMVYHGLGLMPGPAGARPMVYHGMPLTGIYPRPLGAHRRGSQPHGVPWQAINWVYPRLLKQDQGRGARPGSTAGEHSRGARPGGLPGSTAGRTWGQVHTLAWALVFL
jgi:hypothetical protein